MTKRFDSLDVLRGVTITFMCMVNNPGTWSYMYAPMEHAPWTGCTPTDLIYPFFVFCMGCAMAFSFSKFESFNKQAFWKVVKRSVGIFLVGTLLFWYPFFPSSPDPDLTLWQNYGQWLGGKRIFGVLQRIACAYLIAGILALWLRKPGKVMIAAAVLCVLYTAILVIFGQDPGPFTLEGNFSRRVDVALLGDRHVYHGYTFADGTRAAFDPEGPLGSITTAASCLVGYFIGSIIISSTKRHEADPLAEKDQPTYMICKLFALGLVGLAIGEVLSIWIPISKPLWSASYVFYASGWATVMLAFFTFCIDICGIRKPFKPFKIMGLNAMMAFILSAVIVKSYSLVGYSIPQFFQTNEFTSLLHSILFALIIYFFLWIMYKKKWIFKL